MKPAQLPGVLKPLARGTLGKPTGQGTCLSFLRHQAVLGIADIKEKPCCTLCTDCPTLALGHRSHVVGSRCYPEVYERGDCLPCGSHHCCRRLPGHPPRLPGTAQSPRLSSPSEVRERAQTDGTLPHRGGFLGRGVAVGIVGKRGSGAEWGSPRVMK